MTKAVKRFGNVENSLRGGLNFYGDIQVPCHCIGQVTSRQMWS